MKTEYYRTIEQKTRNISPLVLDNMSPAGSYMDIQKLRLKDSKSAKPLIIKLNKTNEQAPLRFVKGDKTSQPYGMLAYYNEKKEMSNNPNKDFKSKFNPEFDQELQ